MQQKGQESDATVQGLRQEIETLRSGKINAERKLNEMEQSLRVCESKQQLIGGSSQQQQLQQGQQVRCAIEYTTQEPCFLIVKIGNSSKTLFYENLHIIRWTIKYTTLVP